MTSWTIWTIFRYYSEDDVYCSTFGNSLDIIVPLHARNAT